MKRISRTSWIVGASIAALSLASVPAAAQQEEPALPVDPTEDVATQSADAGSTEGEILVTGTRIAPTRTPPRLPRLSRLQPLTFVQPVRSTSRKRSAKFQRSSARVRLPTRSSAAAAPALVRQR